MKSGDKLRSPEKEILLTSVEDIPASRSGKRGAHLYVTCQSDSGKTYKLRVFKQAGKSSCSCPSWIFKGARGSSTPGERMPCVHLRTLFASQEAREFLAEVKRVRPGQSVILGKAAAGANLRLALLSAERAEWVAPAVELDVETTCSPRMQAIVAELLASS